MTKKIEKQPEENKFTFKEIFVNKDFLKFIIWFWILIWVVGIISFLDEHREILSGFWILWIIALILAIALLVWLIYLIFKKPAIAIAIFLLIIIIILLVK